MKSWSSDSNSRTGKNKSQSATKMAEWYYPVVNTVTPLDLAPRECQSWIRSAISLIILCVCVMETGCRYDPTVWHMEIPSPDGVWIAIADTAQNGGPGNASIATSISLKRTWSSNTPQLILGFDCDGPVPRPYTLDNVANAGGTINLQMKWLTPSHLEVTYAGNPDLYFQAVKVWGVDISLRNLPYDTKTIPSP
jgi:hypothetical protein